MYSESDAQGESTESDAVEVTKVQIYCQMPKYIGNTYNLNRQFDDITFDVNFVNLEDMSFSDVGEVVAASMLVKLDTCPQHWRMCQMVSRRRVQYTENS